MGSGVAMSSSVRQSAAVLCSSRGVRGDDLAVLSCVRLQVETDASKARETSTRRPLGNASVL